METGFFLHKNFYIFSEKFRNYFNGSISISGNENVRKKLVSSDTARSLRIEFLESNCLYFFVLYSCDFR